jgi:hypothetical protein
MLSKMDLFDSSSVETIIDEPQVISKPISTQRPILRAKPSPKSTPAPVSYTQKSKSYKCDGRQHCSQMTSYSEAVYFNKFCPDTKMDGDRDGIPCEKQFNRR